MKTIRQLIRQRLKSEIPELSRIDRFNRQYDRTEEESPVDYANGAVFVEVLPSIWEQLGNSNIQEADTTIRLHICRTFYGSSASDEELEEPLSVMDLTERVFKALQGKALVDNEGRTVARTLTRTSSEEDNDHNGLQIDILDFTTRVTDYSAAPVLWRADADADIQNTNS